MGSFCRSKPSTTNVVHRTESNIPEWISEGGKAIYDASAPLTGRDFPSYDVNDRVAPFNQDTTNSFAQTRGNIGSWGPAFQSAYAGVGLSANPVGGADIQRYMNPFTDQVINTQAEFLDRQHARNTNQRHAQMAQRGSYLNEGRRAVIDNLANESHARVQAEQASQLRYGAFRDALGQANTERQRLFNAAGAFSRLAGQRQQLGAADAQQLRGLGYTQEARDQQLRDLQYQQFMNSFYYPQEQANWLMALLQGTPRDTQQVQNQQVVTPQQPGLTQGLGALAVGAGIGNTFGWWGPQ